MKISHDEVLNIIENTRRFGQYTGYEVSKHMFDKIGHPEQGMPFVHVAGTNGKGSTTAFLCQMLIRAGFRVGMFTSPHLVEFEERIRINDELISKEDVTRLGNYLLETEFELLPTMFDYCLAMAVLYFKEQHCDIVVMETGIGGMYDSTNALGIPKVAVITKIGYDHTAVLGETLTAIAEQKAGIIKKGHPVVTQRQEEEVLVVLKEAYQKENGNLAKFNVVSKEDIDALDRAKMRMLGAYQKENAAAAILAFKNLLQTWEIEKERIAKINMDVCITGALENTMWRGRMELLQEEPFFMIDGAHNGHGVHALAEGLKRLYPNEKFHFIMGVMADKDYETMIEELLPIAIDFTTVTPESSRSLQAKELSSCIEKRGIPATSSQNMESLILSFLQIDEKKEVKSGKTIAFGSLYFIGEIISLWNTKTGRS